jgi:hypothetical protein
LIRRTGGSSPESSVCARRFPSQASREEIRAQGIADHPFVIDQIGVDPLRYSRAAYRLVR